MKVIITGSTGHIGNNLIRALIKENFQVTALYRNPLKLSALDGLPVQKIQGNVLDQTFLNKAFQNQDYVFHLAGVISVNGDPDGNVMKVNVEGTRNVVEACLKNKVKKLIHFSSNHALKYDENTPEINENLPLADETCIAYDYSKALGEKEVFKGIKRGLNATILSPSSVLGPFDFWNSLQGDMLIKIFKGRMPALVSKGFDWVDVRDVAKSAISAIEKGKPGERYLIGGRYATPLEIAEICSRFSGIKPPRLVVPIWSAMLGLPFVKLQSFLTRKPPLFTYEALKILKHSNPYFSYEKAKCDLGYRARPLTETLKDTYHWFKSQNLV